ncbi:MAG: UbiA family prenyltransferase [Bacteroidia bacterium]|nr:UbiA family prenyltransferase [Bacteroidia bacterium]MDW8014970.1 UbiA family prenyltransferase [Bacteroidia bacterium]
MRRFFRQGEALFRLSRPINLLMIAATSLSALLLVWFHTPEYKPPWNSWLGMIMSTLLIAAGGYWLNDVYDQPIDRINRPNRALWVARAGQRLLISATLGAWLIGGLIGIFLPLEIALLHTGAIIMLAWYARYGKRQGLLGNALIAALTGLVPWEVLLLTKRTVYAVDWMIPLAISFNFVRELVKDAEDLPGDKTYGVSSLPSRISPLAWNRLLRGLWLFLMGLVFLPGLLQYIFWLKSPWLYFSTILVTTILPLLWGLLEWGNYTSMSQLLKMSMIGGLLALWTL